MPKIGTYYIFRNILMWSRILFLKKELPKWITLAAHYYNPIFNLFYPSIYLLAFACVYLTK